MRVRVKFCFIWIFLNELIFNIQLIFVQSAINQPQSKNTAGAMSIIAIWD